MRFHPSKFDALRSMQRPELAVDLLQFTFALNWMRTSIPNYSELVAPLLELLETGYQEVGGPDKEKARQPLPDVQMGGNTPSSIPYA